ncbi:MAG: hypothetical protein SwBeaBPW_32580 [Shewanella algae]
MQATLYKREGHEDLFAPSLRLRLYLNPEGFMLPSQRLRLNQAQLTLSRKLPAQYRQQGITQLVPHLYFLLQNITLINLRMSKAY